MLILAAVMGVLALVFYLLAVLRFLRSGGERSVSTSGIPVGIDQPDADTVSPAGDKKLIARKIGRAVLVGKPDGLAPIEGKPVPVKRLLTASSDPQTMQESITAAKMEVTALSLLLKEKSGSNPQKGILKLPGGEDRVVLFTEDDVRKVETLVQQVAGSMTTKKNIRRNHARVERCLTCEYKTVCEQQLIEGSRLE